MKILTWRTRVSNSMLKGLFSKQIYRYTGKLHNTDAHKRWDVKRIPGTCACSILKTQFFCHLSMECRWYFYSGITDTCIFKYLKISLIHLQISVIQLRISVIQLWISLKEFQISLIQLLISVIRWITDIFKWIEDICNSFKDIHN